MENPRVAMIEHIGGHGGNEFYDLGLCEAISKTGIPVTLYTCTETSVDEQVILITVIKKIFKGVFSGKSKVVKGFRFMSGILLALLDCKKQLHNIAHFHIYHFSLLEFIPIRLFNLAGIKTVATVHDVESFSNIGNANNKRRYLKFEKQLERVIVHSHYAKKVLGHYFSNFEESKIEVIPPLDIDFLYDKNISQLTARIKLGLNPRVPIVLFFGHIKAVKGLDILIRALSLIKKEVEDIQLLIAGRTWKINFDVYEQLIRTYRLESNTILRLEYIPNDLVPYYFKSADLVILPYKKIFNSSVLQRALSYSCAVIASNLEPFLEIIKDGTNGLIFQANNAADLACKITNILADRPQWLSLQKNAQETVKSIYSEKIIGMQLKNFYSRI